MTPDLGRSFLVAVVVLVVPGYFWMRVLYPSTDRAERAVVTVVLSLVLVPLTALATSGLAGSGVGWNVSILAVLAVTVSGAVAHVLLSSAGRREPEDRVPPAAIDAPRALAVAAAMLVLLALVAGLLRGPIWIAAVLLLITVTAAPELVRTLGRRAPPGDAERERPGAGDGGAAAVAEPSPSGAADGGRRTPPALLTAAAPGVLFLTVLALVLARGYAAPLLHGWPQRGGADQYLHAVMTELVMERGSASSFSVYPPGFHVLGAVMAQLSGLAPLDLYRALAPALYLLLALGSYAAARWLLGPRYGVPAAAFVGLLLVGPAHNMTDSAYVALIASTLLQLTAVTLVMLLSGPDRRNAALAVVFASSVVLYHTITTFEAAFIGLASLPLVAGHVRSMGSRRERQLVVATLALVALASAAAAWSIYDIPRTVSGLLGGNAGSATEVVITNVVGTQSPVALERLPARIGEPILLLGMAGLVWLVAMGGELRRRDALPAVLLIVWVVAVFAASRTSVAAFPVRLARDLGLPLALLAAFAFVSLTLPFRSPVALARGRSGASFVIRGLAGARRSLAAAALAATVLVVGLEGMQSLSAAGRLGLVILTDEWAAVGKWLRERNDGGTILTDPWINAPMLAVGGYTGLPYEKQTTHGTTRGVTAERLGPLARDVRWLRNHPTGRRSRALLERYDVRYVVLMKNPPHPRPGAYVFYAAPLRWRAFAATPQTYAVRFETRNAIVFEVDRRAGTGMGPPRRPSTTPRTAP